MSRSGRSRISSSSSSGEEEPSPPPSTAVTKNVYKNDGSFLAMFKKMQEASKGDQKKTDNVHVSSSSTSITKPAAAVVVSAPTVKSVTPMVGKRRGGRALPTGMVKKPKKTVEGGGGEEEEVEAPKDAWSQYMAEVRRYKETSCEEEGKTRPLVK